MQFDEVHVRDALSKGKMKTVQSTILIAPDVWAIRIIAWCGPSLLKE
jgi:hypothetical protein